MGAAAVELRVVGFAVALYSNATRDAAAIASHTHTHPQTHTSSQQFCAINKIKGARDSCQWLVG